MRISDWSSDVCSSDLEGKAEGTVWRSLVDGAVAGHFPRIGMRKPDHLERTMDFGACDLVEEAAQVERREPGRILLFRHGGAMAALLQLGIICRRHPPRRALVFDPPAALTPFLARHID